MEIRNIFVDNPINNTECYLNPVSMVVPDQTLTIRELFQRYAEGANDIARYIGTRKQVYDALEGERLDFDDVIDDLTPNEAFETLMSLKDKRERLDQLEKEELDKKQKLAEEELTRLREGKTKEQKEILQDSPQT